MLEAQLDPSSVVDTSHIAEALELLRKDPQAALNLAIN